MSENLQHIYRSLADILPQAHERKIVLITGARQTGKTTLAKKRYAQLKYINLDSPEMRDSIRKVAASDWDKDVGIAVLDEAQKEPTIFEKIKYSYDEMSLPFSVILGSSQILLLKNIRESLAGRIWLYELWPLMMSEMAAGSRRAEKPLLGAILEADSIDTVLTAKPSILIGNENTIKKKAEDHLLQWGGMPALIHLESDNEKHQWLKNYNYTYLERDMIDLSRLYDLEPFQKFQRLSAFRFSSLLNYSELARDAGISTDTARRYLEYLKISYQVLLLQPYSINLTSSMVKTPKIYWIDMGIVRQLTGYYTNIPTGQLYENMVIAEMYKYIKTFHSNANLYFYRTRSGLEVDIVIETPKGLMLAEIKNREDVVTGDYTAIREVANKMGTRFIGGMVIYRGDKIYTLAQSIWAIPSHRLFT